MEGPSVVEVQGEGGRNRGMIHISLYLTDCIRAREKRVGRIRIFEYNDFKSKRR